jgi:succinate dehydrogenase flavin-adding protein (antitoxin of CptAB toxin-antitoxin module)
LIIEKTSKPEIAVLSKKLKWRSRRSLLELDLILKDFVDSSNFNILEYEDLLVYQEMLEYEDSYLLSLLLQQQTTCSDRIARIVDIILRKD